VLFWRAEQELFSSLPAQTFVLPRTTSRFLVRFLVGVLLFAQLAVAAYACQVIPNGSASGPDHLAVMSMGDAPAVQTSGMKTNLGGTDSEFKNLCLGHCQFGQQNAGGTSTPTVPVALLTSLYALPSVEESAGHARPIAAASEPPPPADPPHAILHCCFRL